MFFLYFASSCNFNFKIDIDQDTDLKITNIESMLIIARIILPN